jgi:hypothetical protein
MSKGSERRPTSKVIPKNEVSLKFDILHEKDEKKKATMLAELQALVNDRLSR